MKITRINIFNIAIVLILLALPYYLFEGKFFIGGDDTRLFYLFPSEWLENISLHSWFGLSGLSFYNPNQFLLPLLLIVKVLQFLLFSKLIVHYLIFSIILILGFVFFQKFLRIVFEDKKEHIYILLASLFYVLSPILWVVEVSKFLYSIWLIPFLPICFYYLGKYLKEEKIKYAFYAALWGIPLAQALYSIPWLLGVFLPILGGLILCFSLFSFRDIVIFFKKALIFTAILLAFQLFWLAPFIHSIYSNPEPTYLNQSSLEETEDTFTPTVLATSKGNIIYPLLNLFHPQIVRDYNWTIKNIYDYFYNKTAFLNSIFILIFLLSILFFRQALDRTEKKFYLLSLSSFLLSLFLFTVNIGFLKNIFLAMGKLPGFVMFRNAYDKFALGYVFIYAILFCFSLIIITRFFAEHRKFLKILFSSIILVFIVNIIPLKKIIVRPLWQTEHTFTHAKISTEYLDFVRILKEKKYLSNVLGLPFNQAAYAIIKEEASDNAYVGTSPLKILSGINDFTGRLSFPEELRNLFISYILNHDFDKIKNFLSVYNVGYILENNNIPPEILFSYLFDRDLTSRQDKIFKENLLGALEQESEKGNFRLYKINYHEKVRPDIITFPKKIYESGDLKLPYLFSLINAHEVSVDNFPKEEYINRVQTVAVPESLFKEIYKFENLISWNMIDCNAYDNQVSIKFNYDPKQDILSLKAENDHNACIYRNFKIEKQKIYRVSFDYKAIDIEEFNSYVDFKDLNQPQTYKEKTTGDWQKFTLEIDPPSRAEEMAFYLYSGRNKNDWAETIYKNIKIVSFPKSAYQDLMIKKSAKDFSVPILKKIEKINNGYYQAEISNIRADFVLNFLESYHPGWKIYSKKSLELPHLKANNYSNLWYFDFNELCFKKKVCQKMEDESYNLPLEIKFKPYKK